MMKNIDFYFDVISPYTYLAHKKIKNINSKLKINFTYKPILLGGLHKKVQITPPAFNEFKMKNMKNDCELIAKKSKIEFCWNDKFPINSINIMRGYLFIKSELKEKFIDFFFDAYWKDNKDLNNIEEFNKILEHLKINTEEYSKAIQNDSIKQKLKDLTDEAFNKEIFGAPTFIVNDKLFWGQDRLEYAIDELENLD